MSYYINALVINFPRGNSTRKNLVHLRKKITKKIKNSQRKSKNHKQNHKKKSKNHKKKSKKSKNHQNWKNQKNLVIHNSRSSLPLGSKDTSCYIPGKAKY